MGEPRRREPHLGVAVALPDLSEHLIRIDPKIVEPELVVSPGEARFQSLLPAHRLDGGVVVVDEKHRRAAAALDALGGAGHDDVELRAIVAGDEPLAAADHPVVAVLAGGGGEHAGIGPGPVRLRHREARADLAGGQRAEPLRLLLVVGDDFQQMHVALVGRRAVERLRPEQRVPGGLEHDGHRAHVEPEAAPLLANVRREQPRFLRPGHQLALERIVEAVLAFPRVPFVRDDHVADEGLGARLELGELGGKAEVDHGAAP